MKVGVVIIHRKKEHDKAVLVGGAFSHWSDPILVEADFGIKAEHDWRNDGLRKAKDLGCELCWVIDADEYLDKIDQQYIIDSMQRNQKDIAMVSLRNYRTANTAIKSTDHTPVVLVNCRKNAFYINRCVNLVNAEKYVKLYLHHFGMLKSEEELAEKLAGYEGTPEHNVFDRMIHAPADPVVMGAEVADFIDLYLQKPGVIEEKKNAKRTRGSKGNK